MSSAVDSAIDTLQRSGMLQGLTLYAFGHTAATEQLHDLIALGLDGEQCRRARNRPLARLHRLGHADVAAVIIARGVRAAGIARVT